MDVEMSIKALIGIHLAILVKWFLTAVGVLLAAKLFGII